MHVVRVERQAVLTLEVLADLVVVQLRAVLRVVVVKELQEPLRLLLDLLLSGALASPSCRFDGRMQTSKTWRRVSSGTVGCQSDRCMFVYGKG